MGTKLIGIIYSLINILFEDDSNIPNSFIIEEFDKLAKYLLLKSEECD